MHKVKHQTTAVTATEQVLTNWSCSHFGGLSEIDVFVEASGKWETAAEVHSVAGIDAEDIANFIIQVVANRMKSH